MDIRLHRRQAGIALIITLLIVMVFGILAGGFAYSMKVETKLARNASHNVEAEWLGRSGIELARYILAQEAIGLGAGAGQKAKAYHQSQEQGQGVTPAMKGRGRRASPCPATTPTSSPWVPLRPPRLPAARMT